MGGKLYPTGFTDEIRGVKGYGERPLYNDASNSNNRPPAGGYNEGGIVGGGYIGEGGVFNPRPFGNQGNT